MLFSWYQRSHSSFFPRCACRACESVDWTRGAAPTPTPRRERFGWSGSAYSPHQAELPRSSPNVLVLLRPHSTHSTRPPLLLSPSLQSTPPPSYFCSRLNQYSPYPSPLRVLFHRHGCPRAPIAFSPAYLDFSGHNLQLFKEPWHHGVLRLEKGCMLVYVCVCARVRACTLYGGCISCQNSEMFTAEIPSITRDFRRSLVSLGR